MPQKISEDKSVKRAEAARSKTTSMKMSVVKMPTFNGLAGAAPYNRKKSK